MTTDHNTSEHLKQLIQEHIHRKQILELRDAKEGNSTPPEVQSEIADIDKKITELQAKLHSHHGYSPDHRTERDLAFDINLQILSRLVNFIERETILDDIIPIFMPFFLGEISSLLNFSKLPSLYYLIAKCYFMGKDFKKSIYYINIAIDSDRHNPEFLRVLINSIYQEANSSFIKLERNIVDDPLKTEHHLIVSSQIEELVLQVQKIISENSSNIQGDYIREMRISTNKLLERVRLKISELSEIRRLDLIAIKKGREISIRITRKDHQEQQKINKDQIRDGKKAQEEEISKDLLLKKELDVKIREFLSDLHVEDKSSELARDADDSNSSTEES